MIVRGNHRRDIFRDRSDCVAYLDRALPRALALHRIRLRVDVHHVHLLIETGAVGLSKISSKLGDNGVGLNNLYNLERS